MVIEALMQGAVDLGMSSELALQFAAKAVEGTARTILASGTHPAIMRDAVCSPGGTTIAGVALLEEKGFKGHLMRAMQASAERYEESKVDE